MCTSRAKGGSKGDKLPQRIKGAHRVQHLRDKNSGGAELRDDGIGDDSDMHETSKISKQPSRLPS